MEGHKHWYSQTNLHPALHGHCFVQLMIDFLLVGGLHWQGILNLELFGTGFGAETGKLAG